MAQSGEIVLFSCLQPHGVIGRINLGAGAEAEDVDICNLEDDGGLLFRVAYTDGLQMFTFDVSSETRSDASLEIRTVYGLPALSDKSKPRPKFRALRFVSSTTLLLLQNAPERSGCVLLLVRLSRDGGGSATTIQRRKLPRTMKIGLGLDVCDLGQDGAGGRQSIVAVSGSDRSIAIFTMEYTLTKGYGKLRPYSVLKGVHPFSMTKICFSTFHPPQHPISSKVQPQKVKLASVSMGNTAVVQTFHLAPFPPLSRTPRYVLSMPGESRTWDVLYSISVSIIFVAVALAFMLGIAEYRGVLPHYIITAQWLPPHVRETVLSVFSASSDPAIERDAAVASQFPDVPVVQVPEQQQKRTLSSMVEAVNSIGNADEGESHSGIVVVRSDGPDIDISIEPESESNFESESATESGSSSSSSLSSFPSTATSSSSSSSPASTDSNRGLLRRWSELDEDERSQWKQRLVDAGYWTVAEGEAILAGVFFGELNNFVGDTVRSLS